MKSGAAVTVAIQYATLDIEGIVHSLSAIPKPQATLLTTGSSLGARCGWARSESSDSRGNELAIEPAKSPGKVKRVHTRNLAIAL